MLLKNNILILSYIPYAYKEGGFCITLYPSNKTKCEEIDLTEKEKLEFRLNYDIKFKNKTPIYKDLLDEYFETLLNFSL